MSTGSQSRQEVLVAFARRAEMKGKWPVYEGSTCPAGRPDVVVAVGVAKLCLTVL